ncbi:unnamed protein product [Caenorhabditis nigoni]
MTFFSIVTQASLCAVRCPIIIISHPERKELSLLYRGGQMNEHHLQSTSSASTSTLLKALKKKTSSSRFLRLYSSDGQRSTRMECDENTTCAEICQQFSCDVITLQIGNYHFRQLKSDTSPLAILHDFCRILTMSDENENESSQALEDILSYTDSPAFRHIFSFFLGRPRIRAKSTLTSDILSEEVVIRKGKLIHSWQNARAVFYNSNIRLQTKNNHDEALQIRNMKVDIYESKKGRSLRLKDDDNCFLIIFQRPNILEAWFSRAQQVERSNHVDASDEQLTLIPEQILNNEARIQILNLRRNSLISRPLTEKSLAPLGYIDDLYRVHSLQVIDLSANQILSFPIQLTLLSHLRQLNLSSNYISSVPNECSNMRRLQYLNLSNNQLDSLPDSISELQNLQSLDISFNQFSQIPPCLFHLLLEMWRLAGNNIEKIERVGDLEIQKIDLRRNVLGTSFRLDIENITHLDLRDNSMVSTVHLTNLRFLKVIHCERLQLTSLHLSGESLTHVYADHNLLDSLVVMPLPQNLQTLSLSFNHFRNLPDWISDCPNLTFLRANNNGLVALPERIFFSPSLRSIFAFVNEIEHLPDFGEENCLETLILYKNKISHLPKHFFSVLPRLRQLNISSNFIELLPYFDGSSFCRLQILRAANNYLTENSVPVIVNMKHLKTIDLSHNRLNSFDDSALSSLELLEDLNLSSNRLTRLADCLALLPCLQVLRAHSNQLVHVPELQGAGQLHTIDLSSNNISLGTLQFKAPPNLRHFDVTCNSGDFDTENFPENSDMHTKMNTINISEEPHNLFGFQIGVSGSRGMKNKQCIRQVRVENTFGFIDGGSNSYMASSICRFLTSYLRENPSSDIRSILLRCHCELGQEGERLGASVMIIRLHEKHIELASTGTMSAAVARHQKLKTVINGKYEIDDDEYSRIREAHGFVDEENRINGVIGTSRQIGHFSTFPVVLPTHSYKNIELSERIEGLIVANSTVWNMLSMEDLSMVFQNNRSPIVVAKKIQDQLQSYDYGGNSNILVLRRIKPQMTFNGFSTISSSSMTPEIRETFSRPKIDEQLVLAVPAMVLPEYHPSPPGPSTVPQATVPPPPPPPIPATRHRTPSPPPPPLPLSTPPPVSSEHEEINIHQSATSSGYTLSIDRFYSSSSTVSSRKQFNETRDLLSKSLKLSPPNTVTFNI